MPLNIFSPKTVIKALVVDDDPEFVNIITTMLNGGLPSLKFEISSSSTISNALQNIEDNHYDLFIFDYRLTDATGLGLLQIVKNQQIKTPVIIVTAYGDEETVLRSFKTGAADYIPKRKLSAGLLAKAVKSALKIPTDSKTFIK
jgi:DNA-binding NtrC family response regulator